MTEKILNQPSPDIRESMRIIPSIFQPFLTWLTGKPLGDELSWGLQPIHHVTSAMAAWAIGLWLSKTALDHGGWMLIFLIPGLSLTIHGTRKLRLFILHQTSHTNLFGKRGLFGINNIDQYVGQALSILLLNGSYTEYKRSHLEDHHPIAQHMTINDPTVKALLGPIGLRVGMSVSQLWRKLYLTLFSPKFHIEFLYSRVASHFQSTSIGEKIATIVYLFILLAIATLTNDWLFVLVAYIFPLTVPYQMSTILRLCTKHLFPSPESRPVPDERDRAVLIKYMASLTHGIFIGDPIPQSNLSFGQKFLLWCVWVIRLVLVHFPSRFFVLVGDSLCHDYHHRYPNSPNWSNYIFARYQDNLAINTSSEPKPSKWPPYTEVWTLKGAINEVFRSMSEADPREFEIAILDRKYSLGDLIREADD